MLLVILVLSFKGVSSSNIRIEDEPVIKKNVNMKFSVKIKKTNGKYLFFNTKIKLKFPKNIFRTGYRKAKSNKKNINVFFINDPLNENRNKLIKRICQKKPDSIFHLIVSEKFINKDGCFEFGQKNTNIKHLKLIDKGGYVLHINNNFLSNSSKLETVEMNGFENLETIGDNFLSSSRSLVSFKTSKLPKLKIIGNNFLSDSKSLLYFDTSGFLALETIGKKFLSHSPSLIYFNYIGLSRVKNLGELFLYKTKPRNLFVN